MVRHFKRSVYINNNTTIITTKNIVHCIKGKISNKIHRTTIVNSKIPERQTSYS